MMTKVWSFNWKEYGKEMLLTDVDGDYYGGYDHRGQWAGDHHQRHKGHADHGQNAVPDQRGLQLQVL
jgi:hypothetical protein